MVTVTLILVVDHFYKALFSALEQAHCTPATCGSARQFLQRCLVVLHGWYQVKLLPSQCTFCAHHTIMHQLTESLHAKSHAGVHVFSCNLHFWENEWALLHAAVVTWG